MKNPICCQGIIPRQHKCTIDKRFIVAVGDDVQRLIPQRRQI